MSEGVSFDQHWETRYAAGHEQRYPWDEVVSFVFRNAPRERPRSRVHILELGCGTGSNLWFAAREGFAVTGVDASASAVARARERFTEDQLTGTFLEADFTAFEVTPGRFDLAIDRASITCCGRRHAARAIENVHHALREGGRMFFNPYGKDHASFGSGREGPDEVWLDISRGTLAGFGQICFYDESDIRSVFSNGWAIESMQHVVSSEHESEAREQHTEWRVIARKLG